MKREVLARAALKPKAIEKYWQAWGADRPPTPVCLDQLVLKGGFTQSAADTFLRVYDATISYAGLGDSDKAKADESEPDVEDPPPPIEVGDLVQVEIGGSLALAKPARVRAMQTLDGKPWVFIDGSESGIPMDQVRLEQKGGNDASVAPRLPIERSLEDERRPKLGWKEERLIDDGGDETFLSYKGEPSVERYEFIRDYLEFRIKRLKKE